MPSKEREPAHCIERDWGWYHPEYFTVSEYAKGLRRERGLFPKARAFYGVIWAGGAPKLEELTLEWQRNDRGDLLRICDWEVYDAQMSELIGLDAPLKIRPPARGL